MGSYKLPDRVAYFLAAHIGSVEEFRLLMALIDAPDRWWDADFAAHDVGIPARVAGSALDRFASANLLDIRVTDNVRYRLRPGTPTLEADIAALGDACRAHPALVLQAVTESARRSIRDFADAFRFKRDGRR